MGWVQCALFAILPWSVEFSFGTWKMTLPSEPLILLQSILLLVYFGARPRVSIFSISFSESIGRWSIIWLGWSWFCVLWAAMPIVSFKYMVVETGHWWAFFCGGLLLGRDKLLQGLRWMIVSTVFLAIYALFQHAQWDFLPAQSNLSALPFFPDNTMFGAFLAVLLPFSIYFSIQKAGLSGEKVQTAPHVYWLASALIFSGLWFSYCRAAWLSVPIALLVGACAYFKIKGSIIASTLGLLVLVLLLTQPRLIQLAKSETADGNAPGVLSQWRSMANMTSDVSNKERLNRYSCAWRMAKVRPILGFGPGNYQFQYFPYQKAEEMTRLSIQSPIERSPATYGRGGSAHSEYFKNMAETGFPGLICWLILAISLVLVAARQAAAERGIFLAILISITGLLFHFGVNNFLHDGRIAAVFWTLAVLLVVRKGRPMN